MSFFRYPGGKRKLRPQIVEHILGRLDGVREYREPFVGGGSIGTRILEKGSSLDTVWFNDIDPGIASIWWAVGFEPKRLSNLLRNLKPTAPLFYALKKNLEANRDVSVSVAAWKIIIHQISFSGLGTKAGSPIGGRTQEGKYKVDCRWNSDSILEKIETLHKLVRSAPYFQASHLPFDAMLAGNRSTFLYLDPPYFKQGNALYQFGMSVDDHTRLAAQLLKTRCRWALSYDDCPQIRDLYPFARIQELEVKYSINSRTNNKQTELLISNDL